MNPKIAGKWMFITLKMVLIGIDPYPYMKSQGGVFVARFGLPEGCGEINQENDFSLGMALKAIRTMGINKNPANNELINVSKAIVIHPQFSHFIAGIIHEYIMDCFTMLYYQ